MKRLYLIMIGLSTASYFGKAVTEDSLELIRDTGVDTIEVFLTTFSEYEPSFGDILVKRLNGLKVHSVHTLTSQFEPQLTNKAVRTRNDAFTILEKVGIIMKKLGASYYTFHGATVIKKSQINPDYEWEAECLRKVMATLASYGGELTYENVHWARYRSPEFIEKMHEYIPELKTCLDIKQAMQSGIDYKEFLKADKGTLRTVHVCDYDGDRLCPPGKGSFDFKEFFKNLYGIGYDGPVMIELYSRDYDSFEDVKESVYYLKNISQQIRR